MMRDFNLTSIKMITLMVRVINASRLSGRWRRRRCRRSRRLPGEGGQGGEQEEVDGSSSGVAREEEGEPGGEEEQGCRGPRGRSESGEH